MSDVTNEEILSRISNIEEMLAEHLRMNRAALPREFISLAEAARMCGRSVQGLTSWLKRERRKVGGFSVRRIRGGVHRSDFEAFLKLKTKNNNGRGQAARDAVDNLMEE